MTTLRVKPEVASVVFDEKTGGFVTLAPHQPFDSADPVVKANRWAFESDDETVARGEAAGRVVSVNMDDWVETATAAPGEKRNVKRPAPVPAADPDADDEGGYGPITTQNFGAAPSLAPPAKVVKASDAAPKVVKKG